MSRTVKLSRRDREIAETVNAAAFVNPFCDEQERLDGELFRVVSSFAPSSQKGRWSDGMSAWLDQSPKEQQNLNTLSAEDRPRMRVVFLFVAYHHFLQELD